MSQKQVNRYHVIMGTLEGKIMVKQAAEKLRLSERQITRMRNGVREKGAAFLIHKNKAFFASVLLFFTVAICYN